MQKALNNIDVLVKQLNALLPMKPEYQQKLDRKFRLEFNYNSNHIEGNTLTYGETELLLIFGEDLDGVELQFFGVKERVVHAAGDGEMGSKHYGSLTGRRWTPYRASASKWTSSSPHCL